MQRKDRTKQLSWCENEEEKEKIQNYLDNYDWVTDISEKFNEKDQGRVCVICGKNGEYKHKGLKYYCTQHMDQVKTYGKIPLYNFRNPNEIKVYDEYASIITKDTQGKTTGEFCIDKASIISTIDYKWYRTYDGYCRNRIVGKLHRHLLGATQKSMKVDHVDRNRFNNKLNNLRLLSDSGNAQNRDLYTFNKTGYAGILEYYLKDGSKKYRGRIKTGGEGYTLKSSFDKEEVLVERLIAEYVFSESECAMQRHLFEKYDIINKAKGRTKQYYYDRKNRRRKNKLKGE